MHCTNHRDGLYIDLRTPTIKNNYSLTNLQQYCYITNLTYAVANVDCFVDIIWYFNKSLLAHDILQHPLQLNSTQRVVTDAGVNISLSVSLSH